jgi:hypothetical protein
MKQRKVGEGVKERNEEKGESKNRRKKGENIKRKSMWRRKRRVETKGKRTRGIKIN